MKNEALLGQNDFMKVFGRIFEFVLVEFMNDTRLAFLAKTHLQGDDRHLISNWCSLC